MKDYFQKYYGKCKLNPCACLDPKKPRFGGRWVGTLCPDWQPLENIENYNDLINNMQKIKEFMENDK